MTLVDKSPSKTIPPLIRFRATLRIALIFIAYLLAFIILDIRSHKFEVYPSIVAWYPPDGLSFAFLLAFGASFLPWFTAATLISSILVFQLPLPPSEHLGWALLVSIIYGAAAWILRQRVRIDIRLNTLRDYLWMTASAAVAAMILAIISVSTSAVSGIIPQIESLWATIQWWIGEMIGILAITPALLIHVMPLLKSYADGKVSQLNSSIFFTQRSFWTTAQTFSIFITIYLAFMVKWPNNFHPIFLIAIPPIWMAIQHGLSGVSIGNILVNFGITWALQRSQNFDPAEFGQLQFMMLIIFSSSLLIGIIVTEEKGLGNSPITEIKRRGNKIVYELIIISVVVMAAWTLEYTFGFFQILANWGARNHIDVIEETLAGVMIMGLAASVFSFRRWREVQFEIKERKKTQSELEALYRELEVRVQERTADLSKANELLKTEINERRQAEEALDHSEKRFRALIEKSADAITLLDSNGVAIYDSPAAPGLLGYYNNELIGQNIFSLMHEEDRNSIQPFFQKLIETPGARLNNIFRFHHKDGSWRWIESISTNLLAEPSVKAIVVNYRDITERKLAEQTLISAQKLYRTLFEQSADAIFILDLQARHVQVNQRATDMLGYSHEELLQLSAADISAEVPQSMNALSKLMEGEALPAYERVFRKKDGSLLDVEPHVTLLRDEEGQPFRVQSIVRDISERKRAELEIRNRTNELSTLYDLSRSLAEANDLEKVLELVNRKTVESIHITFARIVMLEGDSFVTRSVYPIRTLGHDLLINSRQPIAEMPVCQSVMEQDQPVILRSNSQEVGSEERAHLLLDLAQTLCLIPLRIHDFESNSSRILGLLMMGESRKEEREPFTPEKLRLARSIGDQAAIAINNVRLFNDLQHSNIELSRAYEATIAGWSAALDLRDKETEGHTQRVTGITFRLAKRMGFNEDELTQVRYGALLHDIGKMGIPDRILLKPDGLTEDETEVMRMHPIYAYQMLKPISYLDSALSIPYCHHEKWDGTGYPRRLQGEQIPRAAQIFAIVDVYDALTNDRPYRTSWSREKTMEYICGLSGTHFNPQVVDAFVKMIDEEVD